MRHTSHFEQACSVYPGVTWGTLRLQISILLPHLHCAQLTVQEMQDPSRQPTALKHPAIQASPSSELGKTEINAGTCTHYATPRCNPAFTFSERQAAPSAWRHRATPTSLDVFLRARNHRDACPRFLYIRTPLQKYANLWSGNLQES
ncbi:hypothetical protein BU23DRAFT_84446 [Bimuria novae-zelandiae CBS 107.79]|uniref:Uncharacterized protein n=1 Tax=Bimuria novae-zelandiae CBS 107.79 TaxID=1447943 RepID=A0A6A5VCW0_9PLEO|nr:hypothetical protein BU23DRAFT_84446 [Bimuria novae-zelandiae CBS 107.79]